MIRTCPKCGDYYADASLAFCLVDGTPLVDVERSSEIWREGAHVLELKENALRKQNRKLKWRRILVRSMTIVIATLVVCVVAVNSWIYLRPKQPDATTPPAQMPKETPKPTVTPTETEVATSTPSACSDADKNLEREFIIKEFGETWRQDIEIERPEIIDVHVPSGAATGEASLSPLGFESAFSDICTTASLTINYRWEVSFNFNGTVKVIPVAKQKKFTCVKTGSAWRCS